MIKSARRQVFPAALSLVLGSITAGFGQPVEVVVDPGATHQIIEGWGGHVYPQTLPYFDADSTYEDRLLRELQTTHIRLRSVWYLLEAENDDGDPLHIDFDAIAKSDTGLVHDELVLQQKLQREGVKLLFASWRFPYWMIGMPPDWNPGPDEKPELPEGMDDEYVESLLAYMLYARDRYGITFDAVSVANEPDIAIYIAGLTPRRLLDISLKLQSRLREAGYETSYYLPEAAAADSIGRHYTAEFFELPGAVDASVSVAYHSYRREMDVIRFFAELGHRLDRPVWVTEQSHTHLGVENRFEWSHAMSNAACLHDILVDGNASLSLYWSYAMSSSRGLGLYIPEAKAWAPAYDMLKHFYNFVPPGSQRIDVSPPRTDRGLRAVGFILPDGENVTIVLINESATPQDVLLTSGSEGMRVTKIHISSDEMRFHNETSNGVITLPAESVTTVEAEFGR